MAQFKLLDFIDLGTQGYHTYTSWRVTTDSSGVNIIDESIKDPNNLLTWQSPLPDGVGGYYADLDAIYLWIRVHILNTDSSWVMVDQANQNNQMFKISQNGITNSVVNSLSSGIQ